MSLASVVKNPGDNVSFTTACKGTGPLTYVWKKNGKVITGATANTLTLTNLTTPTTPPTALKSAGLATWLFRLRNSRSTTLRS